MLNYPDLNIPVFIDMTMRNEYDAITVCGYQHIMGVMVEKYFRPTGQDINELFKSGYSIAFLGAVTEIIKTPVPLEKLTCKMSLTDVSGPIARFDLGIYNSKDELSFVSVVYMGVFNMESRHLLKDPSQILNFDYFNKGPRLIEADSRKEFNYDTFQYAGSFTIRASYIDASGHTDNLRYVEMIYDVLPKRFRQNMSSLKRFEIYYHHETVLDEKIEMRLLEKDNSVTVIGIKDNGVIAFTSLTVLSAMTK